MILSGSTERVYSADEGVEEVPLGVYIVRGDNIVRSRSVSVPVRADSGNEGRTLTKLARTQTLIGEFDVEADKQIDLSTVRADPISEVQH